MKKGCLTTVIILLTALFLIPVIYFLSFIIICPAINDIAVSRYVNEWQEMIMPEDTVLVATYSFCGNSGGTGNHVEILIGNVFRSELSQEELEAFFLPYRCVSLEENERDVYTRKQMISLFSLHEALLSEGYFCIFKEYDAVTQFDVRGH